MVNRPFCILCSTNAAFGDADECPIPICGTCVVDLGTFLTSADEATLEQLFVPSRIEDQREPLELSYSHPDPAPRAALKTSIQTHYDLSQAFWEMDLVACALKELGPVLVRAWDPGEVLPSLRREILDRIFSLEAEPHQIFRSMRAASDSPSGSPDDGSAGAVILPFRGGRQWRRKGLQATGTDDRRPRRNRRPDLPALLGLIRSLQESLQLDPSNLELRLRLAESYLAIGNTSRAIPELLAIAREHIDGDRAMNALPLLKRILRLDPSRLETHLEIGGVYAALALVDDSRRALSSLLDGIAGWIAENRIHWESPWLYSALPALTPKIDAHVQLARRAEGFFAEQGDPVGAARAAGLASQLEALAVAPPSRPTSAPRKPMLVPPGPAWIPPDPWSSPAWAGGCVPFEGSSMISFMLSTLARQFKPGDWAAFEKAHRHPFLVWEPGPWLPSDTKATRGIITKPASRDSSRGGEALAMALELPRDKDHLVLGRAETADLPINDGTLSRSHLALKPGRAGWIVEELGSSNGSWLNGHTLQRDAPALLYDGSQLQAGQVYLTFFEPLGLFTRLRVGR